MATATPSTPDDEVRPLGAILLFVGVLLLGLHWFAAPAVGALGPLGRSALVELLAFGLLVAGAVFVVGSYVAE